MAAAGVAADAAPRHASVAMAGRPSAAPQRDKTGGASTDADPIREASEPPEARGLRRDEVRLFVSDVAHDTIEHAHFYDLPRWLSAGDVLVVNTSRTLNAALPVHTESGEPFELHLSTQLPGSASQQPSGCCSPGTQRRHAGVSMLWTVELRRLGPIASLPYREPLAGLTLRLPADGRATLLAPYPFVYTLDSRSRLWIAALQLSAPVHAYLERHGVPIRYSYVPDPWPSSMYQTVFATGAESEPGMGSAEMPSAGRPFTPELLSRLTARGVRIAPVQLHTGVASLEDHEPPYEEFYRVTPDTADRVNAARRAGRRIIAVGTTAVRALETVTDPSGITHPGEGWTSLVITRDRPLRAVNGLVTGLHEPRSTHLAILERAIAAAGHHDDDDHHHHYHHGTDHLTRAYAEARRAGYLWHEFGDSHLILGE